MEDLNSTPPNGVTSLREPRTSSPSCWSRTRATVCPPAGSCPTPGWWPPRPGPSWPRPPPCGHTTTPNSWADLPILLRRSTAWSYNTCRSTCGSMDPARMTFAAKPQLLTQIITTTILDAGVSSWTYSRV